MTAFTRVSGGTERGCGALRVSLGELRRLAPGMVLSLEGYDPGMAGLYYGDRAIGHGQLVEVEGRLGLQLSRLAHWWIWLGHSSVSMITASVGCTRSRKRAAAHGRS